MSATSVETTIIQRTSYGGLPAYLLGDGSLWSPMYCDGMVPVPVGAAVTLIQRAVGTISTSPAGAVRGLPGLSGRGGPRRPGALVIAGGPGAGLPVLPSIGTPAIVT